MPLIFNFSKLSLLPKFSHDDRHRGAGQKADLGADGVDEARRRHVVAQRQHGQIRQRLPLAQWVERRRALQLNVVGSTKRQTRERERERNKAYQDLWIEQFVDDDRVELHALAKLVRLTLNKTKKQS